MISWLIPAPFEPHPDRHRAGTGNRNRSTGIPPEHARRVGDDDQRQRGHEQAVEDLLWPGPRVDARRFRSGDRSFLAHSGQVSSLARFVVRGSPWSRPRPRIGCAGVPDAGISAKWGANPEILLKDPWRRSRSEVRYGGACMERKTMKMI